MRNWAMEGYGILADHILDPNYATSVQISFDVTAAGDDRVDVTVRAYIINARQDTYIDVWWEDEDHGSGAEVLQLPKGKVDGKEVTFRGLSIESRPQVLAEWPKSLQSRVWADTDGRAGRMKFVRALTFAGVWMLGTSGRGGMMAGGGPRSKRN